MAHARHRSPSTIWNWVKTFPLMAQDSDYTGSTSGMGLVLAQTRILAQRSSCETVPPERATGLENTERQRLNAGSGALVIYQFTSVPPRKFLREQLGDTMRVFTC